MNYLYQRQLMPSSPWCWTLNVFAGAEWQTQLLWWGLVQTEWAAASEKCLETQSPELAKTHCRFFGVFASAALIQSQTSVWLLCTWRVSPVSFREQRKGSQCFCSFCDGVFWVPRSFIIPQRAAQVLSPLSGWNWWVVLSQQMSFHSAHILVKSDQATRWVCSSFLFQGGWWVKKECARCGFFFPITAALKVMELLYS